MSFVVQFYSQCRETVIINKSKWNEKQNKNKRNDHIERLQTQNSSHRPNAETAGEVARIV